MRIEQERGLSLRQRQTLDAVRAHYAAHGRPPSYKEIGARLGLEKSQTGDLVKACARLGWLHVVRRVGIRTEIRLTRPLEEVATADLARELATRDAVVAQSAAHTGNDPEDLTVRLAA